MPENRVLKYNEVNVQKQKEVSKQHQSLASKNKKGEFVVISIRNMGAKIGRKNRSWINFWKMSISIL